MRASDIIHLINKENIDQIDFRFTAQSGKWHRITYNAKKVTEKTLLNGVGFDGSSIPGLLNIEKSDMVMLPDCSSFFVDPFSKYKTLVLTCNAALPENGKLNKFSGDPRSTAERAEQYLKSSGIADIAYFGPELEFFVLEDVRFGYNMYNVFSHVNSSESPINNSEFSASGNLGYNPKVKGAYFSAQPEDHFFELRSEMVQALESVGISTALHHHEVSPAQCEIGVDFSTVTHMADIIQIQKYVLRNIAAKHGKSLTFMPKPIWKENGSGMHIHQSLAKDGKNLFCGDGYAGLSEIALHYIGGIIKHAHALNALLNPSTNSYKRLVPGYEAPVYVCYSEFNRSAAIRIPMVGNKEHRRIETRFPDATANPYLGFAAMLMAGLDGIKNKIDPGKPVHENVYEFDDQQKKSIVSVSGSLDGALDSLEKDHKFLLQGGVFTQTQLENYMKSKREELELVNTVPHPAEFDLYYSS